MASHSPRISAISRWSLVRTPSGGSRLLPKFEKLSVLFHDELRRGHVRIHGNRCSRFLATGVFLSNVVKRLLWTGKVREGYVEIHFGAAGTETNESTMHTTAHIHFSEDTGNQGAYGRSGIIEPESLGFVSGLL